MTISRNGGFTFAERPELEAPDARILWRAEVDPATLVVVASPAVAGDPDAVDPAVLGPWLTSVSNGSGTHVVLSDGWHHLRIDIVRGSLSEGPVIFHYRLRGLASAELKILPLRRLIDLCRRGRFNATLYPPDRRVARWINALRVHDALSSGATQRDIGRTLFGVDFGIETRGAESLRARVRRLVGETRRLAAGRYRTLLRRDVE